MRQTLQRFSRITLGYGLVQWAGPFLSLIFTPIITRYLTPADYGITDYILTISSALSTLAAFALPQALLAHYNDHADAGWHRRLTGSALAISLVTSISIGAALFLGAPRISYWSFGNESYAHLFQLLGATFVFGIVGGLLTTAAQADLRVRWGMLISLTAILFTVFGNVFFIVILRLGVVGMILTPVTTGIAVFVVSLSLAHPLISRPASSFARLLLGSSVLLLPTVMSAWMLQVVDRLFLINYVSTTELGYYSIANKIASLLGVALTPLYTAWTSLALAIQHEAEASHRYITMSRLLVALTLTGSLALGLFATEILMVLTRAPYLPAAPYVGLLTYIYVFSSINVTLNVGGYITKQLISLSGAVMAGAGVNFILNMILIPRFGVWGATVSTATGYGAGTVLLYWRMRSRWQVAYPMRLFMTALAVQFVLLVAGSLIPPMAFLPRVALKLLDLALLPIAFVGLGLITRAEAREAWLLVRNRLRPGNGA
jgi:O-antigen/teichoic acid export membrane protein